ncbi:MAG: cell division protein FtsZ [Bacteroidota bacterium]|jgi:cell division protein FtsZ
MLEFNMPKNKSSKIKVIGVGGGGTNAVNHMHRLGIKDVDLIVANTDRQSLDASMVLNKIQLGEKLTEGLGAGTNPLRGKEAAEESLELIQELLSFNTKMVFITCGMGGGTGTGAAPVIAKAAKDMNLLTVGIVTTPFDYEGSKTRKQALDGIDELKKHVDAVIVISNETLREEYGDMDIDNAYGKADDILATAAKSIADCITAVGTQNVDFEDVRVALSNSGVAIIGNGSAEGSERARRAVEDALESKLLYDKDIKGAKFILINVTYGKKKITLDELNDIALFVHDKAGADTQIKQGRVFDDSLEDKISVTIIAAGFSNGVSRVNVSLENKSSSGLDIQPVLAQNNVMMETNHTNVMDVSNNIFQFKNEIVNQHEPIFHAKPLLLDFSEPASYTINTNEDEKAEMNDEQKQVDDDIAAAQPMQMNDIVFEITNAEYNAEPVVNTTSISDEAMLELEKIRKANEERELRKQQLKTMSYQFNPHKTSFEEKKVELEKVPHSSDNIMGNFIFGQNASGDFELKPNPFLDPRVD